MLRWFGLARMGPTPHREHFGYEGGEYPVAEAAYEGLISLPLYFGMTDEDIAHVVEAMYKVVDYYLDHDAKAE